MFPRRPRDEPPATLPQEYEERRTERMQRMQSEDFDAEEQEQIEQEHESGALLAALLLRRARAVQLTASPHTVARQGTSLFLLHALMHPPSLFLACALQNPSCSMPWAAA